MRKIKDLRLAKGVRQVDMAGVLPRQPVHDRRLGERRNLSAVPVNAGHRNLSRLHAGRSV